MVILSSLFSGISGMAGSLISAMRMNLPTGPVIVLCLTAIVIVSLLFGSRRGLVIKRIAQIKRHRRFDRRRILLALDELSRSHRESGLYHSRHTIALMVGVRHGMRRLLTSLTNEGLILEEDDSYLLSEEGTAAIAHLRREEAGHDR